jgi:ABC transporter substrate binding protein
MAARGARAAADEGSPRWHPHTRCNWRSRLSSGEFAILATSKGRRSLSISASLGETSTPTWSRRGAGSTPVDVIVTDSTSGTLAAFGATRTIPIVMATTGGDPVALGLASSIARPGGNVTGMRYRSERQARRGHSRRDLGGECAGPPKHSRSRPMGGTCPRGRNRHEIKQVHIRFCFRETATADAFRNRFGGECLTAVKREAEEDWGKEKWR